MIESNQNEILSAASAIGALLSVLFASYSLRVAKRALKLAEKEFEEKSPQIDIYYIDGFKYALKKEPSDSILFGFASTLTNKSTNPNTINSIELIIAYRLPNNNKHSFIIRANKVDPSNIPIHVDNVHAIPLELAPKSAKTGWIFFLLSKAQIRSYFIDKYTIRFIDVNGRKNDIHIQLLKELHDGNINKN